MEIRKASLFGIPMFNKPNIVITKSRLSPFHYLYGLVYARTFQPSFFFSKFISNTDSLRQEIIDGIKKKLDSQNNISLKKLNETLLLPQIHPRRILSSAPYPGLR